MKNRYGVDFSFVGNKTWHVWDRTTSLTKRSFRTRQEARTYAKKINKRRG